MPGRAAPRLSPCWYWSALSAFCPGLPHHLPVRQSRSTSPRGRSIPCRSPYRASSGRPADEAQVRRRHRRRHRQQSRSFRAFPPAAARVLHRADQQFRSGAALRRLAHIQAQALVTGQVIMQPDGRLRAEFRLWDVYCPSSRCRASQFATSPKNWRRMGHLISDAIYKAITGVDGYFDTRIVFVDESGRRTSGSSGSPSWTRTASTPPAHRRQGSRADAALLAEFAGDHLHVLRRRQPRASISTISRRRQREIVGEFPQYDFAPRFSPDGQRVIMSLQSGRQLQHLHARSALAADRGSSPIRRRSIPRPPSRPTAARSSSSPIAAARSRSMS